jgi:hypothetical protein
MELNKKHKAMLASYGRSVLGALVALYIAGITDPKDLWAALVAALAPVALRAINPNDPSFGRLPKVSSIEDALKNVKAPIKKPAKQDSSLTKTEEKLFGITNEELDKLVKPKAKKKTAKKPTGKKK